VVHTSRCRNDLHPSVLLEGWCLNITVVLTRGVQWKLFQYRVWRIYASDAAFNGLTVIHVVSESFVV